LFSVPSGVFTTSAGKVYFVTSSNNTMHTLDLGTNTIINSMTVFGGIYDIAATPDGTKAYITNYGAGNNNSVSVVWLNNYTLKTTVTVGTGPYGLAISPDGTKVYVCNKGSSNNGNTVSVISTSNDTAYTSITVGTAPVYVSFSPDGTKAYVSNLISNTISVINPATNAVITSISGITNPFCSVFSLDSSKAYVSEYGASDVKVISTSNNTITNSVTVNSGNPMAIDITPDGSKIYVNCISTNKLTVINTANLGTTNLNVGGNIFIGKFISTMGPPITSFTASQTSGFLPLTVYFSDTSTSSPSSFYWDFGDGHTSTAQNPTNVYQNAGTYTVKHSTTNAAGTNWSNITNMISVNGSVVVAFTADQTNINAGSTVHFTDQSTGTNIDSWAWDTNGDGVTDYTTENPSTNYLLPGSYTVTLKASSSSTGSTNTLTKTGYIKVSNSADCSFISNTTSGNVPLAVLFNDTSLQSANSWTWAINGVQQATTQNLTIVFNNAGTYTVTHTATGAGGTGSATAIIHVYAANYGGLYGYITDSNTNLPLSGVTCQLSNLSATATINTDSNGYYYFWPVYNGVYNLTVTKTNYVTGSLPNTIINGNTLIQNISLTSSGNLQGTVNITNYSSQWLSFAINSDTNNKTIALAYSILNGSCVFANTTIYNNQGQVYTSNLSTNSGTINYQGSGSNNYLVTFSVKNSLGETYNGAYSVVFFRGLPTGFNPLPADYPAWLVNSLIVLITICCFLFFGKAYIEVGLIMGSSFLAANWIWGFLNLSSNVQVPVVIGLAFLIAGGEYLTKRKILGS
jgi:YVTN family beta-propeller protein